MKALPVKDDLRLRTTCMVLLTIGLAFAMRLTEWPAWQNPEYRMGSEWLLATHDAYHWLAGAEGIGLAVGHPMAKMLDLAACLPGLTPATVAFWFPAILSSLVAAIVCLWVWALGSAEAGVAAGIIATLAPGFLGRTLLGYYDTDLVTLFFPLLMTLAPAVWVMRSGNPLKLPWLAWLGLSGLLTWWAQEWHSVFPYLARYNIVLAGALALLPGNRTRRPAILLGAMALAMPTLFGPPGLLACVLIGLLARPKAKKLRQRLMRPDCLTIVWLVVLGLMARGEILNTLINHANAYLKHSGDLKTTGQGLALVYPSVAQSITEVQDVSLASLLPYFHPWVEASALGLAGFALVIIKRPGALYLLPLAALGLLGTKLGGRMVMFGAPIVAIGLSLPLFWLLQRFLRRDLPTATPGTATSLILLALLVLPLADMIPSMSQGPMINRRHAEALTRAQTLTPPESRLWVWWDWGYATHHFARRQAIADGAQHAGPSLYLPAAVFATDNPRFARQIIHYTAQKGNEPGNVFAGLDGEAAQALMDSLRSPSTPLVEARSRQFVIVSFEMLRLGFWISTFGNWNFVSRQGESGALSIIPQAVAYKLDSGEVRLENSAGTIYASSISLFAETGVTRRNYIQEWFDAHPNAERKEQQEFLGKRRNVHFLFNRVTDEKLAVDARLYNSMLVQLLVCDPQDQRFSPYFKLVYDNVFARIYEVL